jgi:hypothetical protein
MPEKKKRPRPRQEAIYVEIKKSNAEVEARNSNPGKVMCLGWCNKMFHSTNKTYVRFCEKCRRKKDEQQQQHSLKTYSSAVI